MTYATAEDSARASWDRRANTPLAKARKSRTYAEKRLLKAKANVEAAERDLATLDEHVREMERLVARGVRGLN
jgi:flagellar motility protein MotE (MotC chaperone)